MIVGLTRSTEKSHIARAALDAIALSVAEVLGCLEASSGHRLPRLRVDGGACVNDLLMQTQADVLGVPVDRPVVLETTALGAGLLAGLATDFYPSAAAVSEARSIEKTFHPQIDESQRRQRLDQWRDAVGRCRGWARPS